jgi:hypothetical protein
MAAKRAMPRRVQSWNLPGLSQFLQYASFVKGGGAVAVIIGYTSTLIG